MENKKDIDELYLEALGYYASLSVISVLASYILKVLSDPKSNLTWILILLLSILILALLAFFAAIHEALTNKIWIPMLKLAKDNPESFSARIGHDVLIILYFAILIFPPFYSLSNIN